MKKGLMGLVASAVLCSMAFASPTANEPSFTGLNSTEHAALFGDGATSQVVALDGAEMKVTEGEILPFLLISSLAYNYVSYLNAPTLNGRVYSGRVYRSLPRRR
jgi:hypothetical protein